MTFQLDQGITDHTVAQLAAAITGGNVDMDPFSTSRNDLADWFGGPTARGGLPDTHGVRFVYGDDHADSHAVAKGIDPHASNWRALARSQIGTPYVFGSTDCSGFTQWLVKRATGLQLPHNAQEQSQQLQKVDRQNLEPGDLLFFAYQNDRGVYISHVEVYLGGNRMIGNANPVDDLDISPVDWSNFVQGGRVPGMSGTAAAGMVSAAKAGKKAVKLAAPGPPPPLTTPFVMGSNYFTAALGPMMAQDPRQDPQQGFKAAPIPGNPTDAAGIKAAARQMVLQRGWSLKDYQALVQLWSRESGWDPNAVNHSSGATGIPQLLPSAHDIPANWHDPMVQLRWGLNYISERYGSPSAAWQHETSQGWY